MKSLPPVIPDNSSERLKAALQDAGVNTVEYIAGDEADRLAKVNSVNDAAFSREIPEANYEALKEKYGYIPAGERAYREVQVPKKTADDKYVSRTIRTVLEAKGNAGRNGADVGTNGGKRRFLLRPLYGQAGHQ